MLSWIPAIVALCSVQEVVLRPDGEISGRLDLGDPPTHTTRLEQGYRIENLHAEKVGLRVQEDGVHRVLAFLPGADGYLVLRGPDGEVLAENDDYIGLDPALEFAFQVGVDYRLEVCALNGGESPFRLILLRGGLPHPDPAEEDRLYLEDLSARAAWAADTFGGDSTEFHLRAQRLGRNLVDRGRAAEAVDALAAAHQHLVQTEAEPYPRGRSAYDYARCAVQLGDLKRAQQLFREALACFTEAFGITDSWTLIAANALADLCTTLGDYGEALGLHQDLVNQLESIDGLPRSVLSTYHNNYGTLLLDIGDYAQARHQLERSLELLEGLGSELDLARATTLNNLGNVFLYVGLRVQAKSAYQKALALRTVQLGEDDLLVAQNHQNLAMLAAQEGDEPSARKGYAQALQIYRMRLGANDHRTAGAMSGLARVELGSGNLDAAMDLFREAEGVFENELGADHPRTLSCGRGRAAVLRKQGALQDALELNQRLIDREEALEVRDSSYLANMWVEQALILEDLGQYPESWEGIHRALQLDRQRLSRELYAFSESERLQALSGIQWKLDLLCTIATLVMDPAMNRATLEEVVMWKRISSRLVTARLRVATEDPELASTLLALRAVQAEISKAFYETADGAAQQDLEALGAQITQREFLERRIQEAFGPQLAHSSFSLPVQQGALPPAAALVHFYHAAQADLGSKLLAWVVTRDQVQMLDLGASDEIAAAIEKMLLTLGQSARGGRTLEDEQKSPNQLLLRRLWNPLAAALGDRRVVYFCVDSFLNRFPLGILRTAAGRYLIEDYDFRYLQNPAAIGPVALSSSLGGEWLGVGGVDYNRLEPATSLTRAGGSGLDLDLQWSFLNSSGPEAESIHSLHASLFPDHPRNLLEGVHAGEANLKAQMPAYSILHFATHGFYQPEDLPSLWDAGRQEAVLGGQGLNGVHPGLLAGLVCSGANLRGDAAQEDGYLTADEVSWLELSKADLVVLSACQTSVGAARAAEGLISVRRAFHLAGAREVISSVCAVSDSKTRELMFRFYGNYWYQQQPAHAALRAAQLRLLRDARARNGTVNGDPWSWGVFLCTQSGF